MLNRFFVTILVLIFGSSALAFSPVCSVVLSPESVYDNIKRALNGHTESNSLTASERELIENLILQLERKVNRFDSSFNRILAPYGTAFLPRLKEKLEVMSADFRKKNWQVINELRRYLGNGELKYRDLDIFEAVRFLKTSAANRFVHNPDHVYFGLDFFVDTLKISVEYGVTGFFKPVSSVQTEEGYRILTPQESQALGSDVKTLPSELISELDAFDAGDIAGNLVSSGQVSFPDVVDVQTGSDLSVEFYPGTRVAALSDLEEDGLPFRGFPLTKEFLDFLKNNGNEKGHIIVAAAPILEDAPRVLDNLGVTSSSRRVAIESVSRYHQDTNSYLNVFDENRTEYQGFFNAGIYNFDQNGVLVIPAIRVNKEKPRNLFLIIAGLPEITISAEGEYSTYASPYEFFIALISKVYEDYR